MRLISLNLKQTARASDGLSFKPCGVESDEQKQIPMAFERLFSIRKSALFEFLVVFIIAVLARGNSIFGLNWSCDDFLSIADSDGLGYAVSQASQLRVFAALTTRLVGWLGGSFPPIGSLWGAAHTAAMVVFALALRKLWIPRSASVYGILIGLLFTLFPYHINLLAFQLQHPSMVMSYLTGAYGLANFNKPGWWQWTSVLAIAASLSYQTMISYYVAAGLVLLVIQLFRQWSTPAHGAPAADFRPVFDYIKLIALGVVSYLFISLLSLRLLGLPTSERTAFAGLDSWRDKLQLVVNHLKRTAYGKEPSMARSTKLLQSMLWLVVATGLSTDLLRQPQKSRKALLFLPILLAVSALTVAAAFLPTILMDHTSENPRNLLATVIFGGGLLALSSLMISRRLKIVAISLASLLALSYAIITNTLSVDIARLANRDLLNATQMVARLNQLSGEKTVRTVVFMGSFSPNQYLQGREHFQSGFQVNWAQLPLLQEATGQMFTPPTETDRAKVTALASNRPAWPAEGSIAVDGDVGLIVLSQPTAPTLK